MICVFIIWRELPKARPNLWIYKYYDVILFSEKEKKHLYFTKISFIFLSIILYFINTSAFMTAWKINKMQLYY